MDEITKAVHSLQRANRILVFTGAGISTNCGVPDFRGPNGLYSRVKEQYGLPYGEALFDISYFQQQPEAFYNFSKELFCDEMEPSLSHHFLAKLEEQGKIEILVTQNIDMLHIRSGSINVVECHGTYQSGHCLSCGKSFPLSEFEQAMKAGEVPHCSCGGVLKPDIVFFGETLPESFNHLLSNPPEADLLLVLGTSLTVYPATSLVLDALQRMPSIMINLGATEYDHLFDQVIYQDIDITIKRIQDLWEVNV